MCPDRHEKDGWPEAGAFVLIACAPWRATEEPFVCTASFAWEGKDNWRPTFRGGSGDSIKSAYAWAPTPEAPPVPEVWMPKP